MENAQLMSFFPEGEKVGFSSFLLRDRARNWWDEIGRAMGTEAVAFMSWEEFVTRFYRDFAPMIEV